MPRHSIRRRLLLASSVVLFAFLGLAGIAIDAAFGRSAEAAVREQLRAHAYTLLAEAEDDENGRLLLAEALASPDFNLPDSGLYAQVQEVGPHAAFRWRSASSIGRELPPVASVTTGETTFRFLPDLVVIDQGISWEDLAGNDAAYRLSIAVDAGALQAQRAAFRNNLWQWLGGSAVVLLTLQLTVLRWGLQPIRSIADGIARIEQGDSELLDGPVPVELEPLTDSINSLIRHNEGRQQRMRNSLADLAHSLKTPLAVLRGAATSGDSELRRLIDEQTGRIDQIVSYQRQRAAVAGSRSLQPPIAVAPIVERICNSLGKVHRDRGIQCRQEIAPDVTARADQGDLFEILGNLLENAYKYGRTQIICQVDSESDMLRVEVHDDGPGIPAEQRDRLMKRGERADSKLPGSGIGLSVVDEIVREYRGHLQIGDSHLGGARVIVRLG